MAKIVQIVKPNCLLSDKTTPKSEKLTEYSVFWCKVKCALESVLWLSILNNAECRAILLCIEYNERCRVFNLFSL